MKSGRIPACSQANIVPVRPKPTAISSAMRCTWWRSQASRSSARYTGSYMRMPPAHCTSGSTITAQARVVPEVKAHLHRHLDRGRAVVGIEAAGEAGGGDRTELLREHDHRLVGEACEDYLLELLELRAHRGVDAGIRVPEEIHPPGADGIEVALALVILEPRARAAARGARPHLLVVLHLR